MCQCQGNACALPQRRVLVHTVAMNADALSPEFSQWLVTQAQAGARPEQLIAPLLQAGWEEDAASTAVDAVLRRFVAEQGQRQGLPPAVPVPTPFQLNGPSQIQIDGQAIHVLGSSLHPRVVLLGNVLSADECTQLIATARGRLQRSATFNAVTGANEAHQSRTSDGTYLPTACTPLVARIEQRIADLVGWPLEQAEPLQVLHYGPGAEYQPHYDYFDPDGPGGKPLGLFESGAILMYLAQKSGRFLPADAALRWQTIAFSLENLPVARNRIQSITLVLSDRKGKGQIFIDRIRLLLP